MALLSPTVFTLHRCWKNHTDTTQPCLTTVSTGTSYHKCHRYDHSAECMIPYVEVTCITTIDQVSVKFMASVSGIGINKKTDALDIFFIFILYTLL